LVQIVNWNFCADASLCDDGDGVLPGAWRGQSATT